MKDVELTRKSARIVRIFLEDPDHPRFAEELVCYAKMSYSTLYPILGKLAAAGWLAKQPEDIEPAHRGSPAADAVQAQPRGGPAGACDPHGDQRATEAVTTLAPAGKQTCAG